MAIRRIRQLGDPVLREVSTSAIEAAATLAILEDLRDTLHEFQRTHGFGRGISAVQIGMAERVIYLEFEGRQLCLVNPVYEYQSSETFQLWDDCFSFPDLLVFLERAKTVRVRYHDEHGELQRVTADAALSELLQHEMDHLDGVLAIDRALDGNALTTREEWLRRHKV